MAPFCGWDSASSRPQSHYEKAVYFPRKKFPEIPGTHLMDLGIMKG